MTTSFQKSKQSCNFSSVSRRNLSNPELELQYGCSVHQRRVKSLHCTIGYTHCLLCHQISRTDSIVQSLHHVVVLLLFVNCHIFSFYQKVSSHSTDINHCAFPMQQERSRLERDAMASSKFWLATKIPTDRIRIASFRRLNHLFCATRLGRLAVFCYIATAPTLYRQIYRK